MLRVGIIGCGFIARKHVKTIAHLKDFSLTAVSDLYYKKMKEITSLYQREKRLAFPVSFHPNYQSLLADPRIDVIVVATASHLHAKIAKEAIMHGKHVIVEKPLALSMKDMHDLIELAEKRNKHILVCHQLRYRPLIQKINRLINDKKLGEIYFGSVTLMLNRSLAYYRTNEWKGTWEKDGGMLINQGIHLVDLLIWMLGDVKSVYGDITKTLQTKETEDIALGFIQFQSGAKGLINANTITKPKNLGYSLAIFGEKGSIVIGGKYFNQLEHAYIEEDPELIKELQLANESNDDEHAMMYKNFSQAINGEASLLMSAKEAKQSLESIFALYQSSVHKKPINLPLQHFSTTDMLRKDRGDL